MMGRHDKFIRELTGHRRTCLLLLVFFVLFFVSNKAVALLRIHSYVDTAFALLIPIIITATLYILIMKPDMAQLFRMKKIKLQDAFLWFFLGICANCALTVINIPVNAFWSRFAILPTAIAAPQSFGEYMLGVLCIAIVPAICEEMFCRGIVLREYERYGRAAMLASALAFMVLHNSVTSAVYILLLGLILAFIVLRTDSIFPAMIFHFAVNFLSLTVNYVSANVIPPHIQPEFALVLNMIFILMALTFALVVLSIFVHRDKIVYLLPQERTRYGFSWSLVIIVLFYVYTQIMYFTA